MAKNTKVYQNENWTLQVKRIADRPRIKFEGDNKERHEAFHCYTRNNSESSALMKINILDPTK